MEPIQLNLRSVELFSGCGGLALGLSKSGFTHERMVEWNSCAVATIRHNIDAQVHHVVDWPIERLDVRDVDWSKHEGACLVAGGPPCQPFSIGGKHRGGDDHRNMWPEAVRAVRQVRPQAFLFENVRGLLRSKFSPYLESIVARLANPDRDQRLSYNVQVQQVDAADFGAPQRRHRVLITGFRTDLSVRPAPLQKTHSRERLLWDKFVTGEYWTDHGLPLGIDAFSKSEAATVARLRHLKEPPSGERWVTVRDALKGLGEPTGQRNHVFQPGARVYKGHTGCDLDQPAKALKAGDHGVPGGENMMITDEGPVRYFTLREAARLQGLPDEFGFPRSWTESMRQLGNAVPVQLAEAAGDMIIKTLTDLGGVARQAA